MKIKTLQFCITIACTFLISLLFSQNSFAADSAANEIQDLAEQWTGLAHQKDTLIRNWRNDRPVLEQQLVLLERENLELNSLLEETQADQGEVEERRLNLLEQQTQLEQEQTAIERELSSALIEVEGLYSQLPPPLIDAWDENILRLTSGLLNNSETLQVILEMLGQLDDFQRKITLHQAVMTMDDGTDYLVTQVYLGLSHGWYVSTDGLFAGSGKASSDGWQWQVSDQASVIAQIISIMERTQNTELLSLPIQLSNSGGVQ